MKKQIIILGVLAVLVFSVYVQTQSNRTTEGGDIENSNSSVVNLGVEEKTSVTLHSSINSATDEKSSVASESLTLTKIGYEEQAKQLISKAFSYDPSDITPSVDNYGDLITLRYSIADDNYFIVEFHDGFPYPATLYHFSHIGEDTGFNLAEESSDFFSNEMVTTAKNFVQDIFGVDCTNANIHAYGYANKISVQLEVASDQIFHVRFYYKDPEPVGVLFCNSIKAFERAMETNKAKMYY